MLPPISQAGRYIGRHHKSRFVTTHEFEEAAGFFRPPFFPGAGKQACGRRSLKDIASRTGSHYRGKVLDCATTG
jgi:hypothetical protein